MGATFQEVLGSFSGRFSLMSVALRTKILAGIKYLCAQHQGTFEMAWGLIKQGSDVNARLKSKRTALHMAAENGMASAITKLVSAGADASLLDRLEQSALDLASDEVCRQELKRFGADGWTALMIAAESGDFSTLQRLIDGEADVRASNRQQRTALHLAAEAGNHKAVQALLQAKASLRAVDVDGRAAIDLAEASDSAQCVEILITAGAVISSRPVPPKKGDKVSRNHEP